MTRHPDPAHPRVDEHSRELDHSPAASSTSLTRADAVQWLRTLADTSVDLILTDPPYESIEKHRAVGTTTRLKHSKASSNDWFQVFPNSRFTELFVEIYRVLKNNRHFYLFCDHETMFVAKPLAERAGFRFWKPLVWDKMKIGLGYHYRARYELILFFEKGKRKLNDLGVPDIIHASRIHKGYPAEKPTQVNEILIRQSTQPAELVVDPFMGSASTGVAALTLGRRFMGSDICREAINVAEPRLLRSGATQVTVLPLDSSRDSSHSPLPTESSSVRSRRLLKKPAQVEGF